ncbi:MAG: von Willebrand factor type A domain-containing protein [Planctomycetota bacterium]|nr:von Willebrand factor type A domain-containing protein [Planctomycetota bacterium]
MKNEFNELGLSEAQRLQALVCAYVLGELDEAERAEVEAALEQQPELRAEKARFEATIGVVSGALAQAQPASLSKGAAESLDAALAKAGHAPIAWYRRTWVRAAAAVALVTGGVLLVKRSQSEIEFASAVRENKVQDTLDAKAKRAQEPDAEEMRELLALGYVDHSGAPAAKPAESGEKFKDAAKGDGEPGATYGFTSPDSSTRGLAIPGQPPADTSAGQPKTLGEMTGEDFLEEEERLALGRKSEDAERMLKQIEANAGEQSVDELVLLGAGGAPAAGSVRHLEPAPEPVAELGVPAQVAATARPAAPGGATTGGGGGGDVDLDSFGVPMFRSASGSLSSGARAEGSRGKPAGESKSKANEAAPASDDFFMGRGEKLERFDRGDEVAKERKRLADKDGEDADLPSLGGLDFADETALLQRDRLERLRQIEQDCYPRPNESPRDMYFRFWGDNPFELTALDRLSTFSTDVDTASYALARRYLVDGHLPTKAQVRTEEFVNYFKGDVAPPSEGTFRLQMELAPSLFGDSNDTWMLRVALRGKEITKQERAPLALTFVIDVSGSMREESRLELVKHALRLLVGQLDSNDTISIVKFSNDAAVVLPPTSARHRDLIESAIHPLQPEGSTNTESGLRVGYAQASAALTKGAQNRVVLLTDGVANVGITDPNALVALVETSRRQGVMLNTIGVGMDNHNDNLLEQLADKGDGLCNYVDDEAEVRRALVDNFTGAFQAIARDTKLQVEFDPAQVERYRLLGYENRAVADADFRNAKVDAAEIGAGHQVVALYEIVRTPTRNADGPLAVARVRWKAPYANGVADAESNESEQELETRLTARDAIGGYMQATAGYRRSVLVGQFAEFLRRSVHARTDSLDRLIAEAQKLDKELRDPDFSEFVSMVQKSRELVLAEQRRRDWVDDCGDVLRHNRFLRQQIEDLQRRSGEQRDAQREQGEIEELRRQVAQLETQVAGAEAKLDKATIERLQADNVQLQRRVIELLEKLMQAERDRSGK